MQAPTPSPFSRLLASLSSNANERGAQFERICLWFLRNDPRYEHLFSQVMPYSEWEHGGADIGTDLIAIEHGGKVWAVQAKCYDERYQVTKGDVDSFLSDSARAEVGVRLLLATTDQVNNKALLTLERQEKPTEWQLRSQLEEANVVWPKTIEALELELRGGPAKKRKLPKPRPDQREAINKVCTGIRKDMKVRPDARGQLIMACGTGKTLTAHWIVERLRSKRTICFVPSISLINQTMGVWLGNEKRKNVAYLPVCSDGSVTKDRESGEDMRAQELGVPVTTDPEQIAAFLRGNDEVMVFATYQSSPKIVEALALVEGEKGVGFDLLFADEAHRCAGTADSIFATVLDDSKIPCPRRIFMTATPRYFRERDRQGEVEIASMNDETAFGRELYRLSFGQAIELGILADYQVVVIGVTDGEVAAQVGRGSFLLHEGKQTDARSLGAELGLIKAIGKYDLRRLISFHRSRAAGRAFQADLAELLGDNDRPGTLPAAERTFPERLWSAFVSGDDSSEKRNRLLRQFGQPGPERKLLSNARCLTEGVNVPSIDGVCFVDPKGSRIDIIQAVGRAIRTAPGKEKGTIVIPVFIEQGADDEATIEDSAFKPVWDVLIALRAHDEKLGDDLDELRRSLARGRTISGKLPGKIVFDVPESVSGIEFRSAFEARLVEATTASWEFWYGLLEQFVAENGTTLVPQRHITGDGFHLGSWVSSQRRLCSEFDRRARLDAIGFIWEPYDAYWEEGYAALVVYAAERGHTRAPLSYVTSAGFRLGTWVSKQRHGSLAPDRRARLTQLGFAWAPRAEHWEEGYGALADFVSEHGHARVPHPCISASGFRLGQWVNSQRSRCDDPQRRARLDDLGFVWDPFVDDWEQGIVALTLFVRERGHARIAHDHVAADGFQLGVWTANQRKRCADPERRATLDSLGFVWGLRAEKWERGYESLASFLAEHGHTRVAMEHVADDGYRLGQWVGVQRSECADPDRRARLDKLGFIWVARAS